MTGIDLIAQERERQKEVEGWSPSHDDQYYKGELIDAAICYSMAGALEHEALPEQVLSELWPWQRLWWKPKDRITNLKKAGALIAAEIDRLERFEKIYK